MPSLFLDLHNVKTLKDITYDIAYDIVCDVTWFIQPSARLLHQPTLLPSDGASKLQLLSALTLTHRAPDASRLHP